MEKKLIKIDKNGSKHYEALVKCDRCGGRGYYAIGIANGVPVVSPRDGGVCYKCEGTGVAKVRIIERTPEYQAKLDARRIAKQAEAERREEEAKRMAEEAVRKAEAERMAQEAQIEAQKAVSQYVGEIGQRLTVEASYEHCAWYEAKSFSGFGYETRYIHTFRDADGNVLVWKTGSGLEIPEGAKVLLKGTVKSHDEYRGEKQTVLLRCKVEEA